MYNRYIGNTGTYVRVDEPPARTPQSSRDQVAGSPAAPQMFSPPPEPAVKKKPSLLGGLGDGLGNLLGAFGGLGGKGSGGLLGALGGGEGGNLLGGITDSVKGLFEHLPFGLEAGDILLFLLLLFFYIESGDDEFLIILAIVAFSLIREN